jgi:hypothetical protein
MYKTFNHNIVNRSNEYPMINVSLHRQLLHTSIPIGVRHRNYNWLWTTVNLYKFCNCSLLYSLSFRQSRRLQFQKFLPNN